MSAVLCLPACLCVSPAASRGQAPHGNASVPVPDGVLECGLSELRSSIHSDDETEHDAFFVQTCVEEVENAEYVAPLKPLLSMRAEDPVDEEVGRYVDSGLGFRIYPNR